MNNNTNSNFNSVKYIYLNEKLNINRNLITKFYFSYKQLILYSFIIEFMRE